MEMSFEQLEAIYQESKKINEEKKFLKSEHNVLNKDCSEAKILTINHHII